VTPCLSQEDSNAIGAAKAATKRVASPLAGRGFHRRSRRSRRSLKQCRGSNSKIATPINIAALAQRPSGLPPQIEASSEMRSGQDASFGFAREVSQHRRHSGRDRTTAQIRIRNRAARPGSHRRACKAMRPAADGYRAVEEGSRSNREQKIGRKKMGTCGRWPFSVAIRRR
jgi:hypothetical protein